MSGACTTQRRAPFYFMVQDFTEFMFINRLSTLRAGVVVIRFVLRFSADPLADYLTGLN